MLNNEFELSRYAARTVPGSNVVYDLAGIHKPFSVLKRLMNPLPRLLDVIGENLRTLDLPRPFLHIII